MYNPEVASDGDVGPLAVQAVLRQSIPSTSIENCAERQRHHAVFGLGPNKTAPFQAFGIQDQPLPVPEQSL